MLCAELAAEKLMLLPHVLLELLKPGENLGLRAAETLGQQQMPVLGIDLLIHKIDVILFLTVELLIGQRLKGFQFFHKHHLVELLPADSAVLLIAQHPHLGGAAVTNGMVTFSQGEDLDLLAAQNTVLLRVFCRG